MRRIVLTEEQTLWLRKWYPVTENARLAVAMGVALSSLHKLANNLGLKKSARGLAAIQKRRNKAMVLTNERNGCYDRKRGHPVSEATKEGLRRRRKMEREGLCENAMMRIKRTEPERYAMIMRKRSESRRDLIRKEKLRVKYGLERKTRLTMVVDIPYTQSQRSHRSHALSRGYLLDEDCSEGTEGRYVIYYDDETERSLDFENNCINDGFTIKKDE